MGPLSNRQLVQVWEEGQAQHGIDRALTILAAASPETPRAELAALTIGRRDARLLWLREMTFGPHLACFAVCPGCSERLQFTLSTADIGRGAPAAGPDTCEFALADLTLKARLPDSHDLAAAAVCTDRDEACRVLVERCLVRALKGGAAVSPRELSAAAVMEVAERVAALDPQAEVRLDLACAGCGGRFGAVFDVVSFFWQEIAVAARRLLEEVAVLARAFGWSEGDILALSRARRRFYLERAA